MRKRSDPFEIGDIVAVKNNVDCCAGCRGKVEKIAGGDYGLSVGNEKGIIWFKRSELVLVETVKESAQKDC